MKKIIYIFLLFSVEIFGATVGNPSVGRYTDSSGGGWYRYYRPINTIRAYATPAEVTSGYTTTSTSNYHTIWMSYTAATSGVHGKSFQLDITPNNSNVEMILEEAELVKLGSLNDTYIDSPLVVSNSGKRATYSIKGEASSGNQNNNNVIFQTKYRIKVSAGVPAGDYTVTQTLREDGAVKWTKIATITIEVAPGISLGTDRVFFGNFPINSTVSGRYDGSLSIKAGAQADVVITTSFTNSNRLLVDHDRSIKVPITVLVDGNPAGSGITISTDSAGDLSVPISLELTDTAINKPGRYEGELGINVEFN